MSFSSISVSCRVSWGSRFIGLHQSAYSQFDTPEIAHYYHQYISKLKRLYLPIDRYARRVIRLAIVIRAITQMPTIAQLPRIAPMACREVCLLDRLEVRFYLLFRSDGKSIA